MSGLSLHEAEERLEDLRAGIRPLAEPVSVDSLAGIIQSEHRLVLAPRHSCRYVPAGIDESPTDPKDDFEGSPSEVLESFFQRGDVYERGSDRAILIAALMVARSQQMPNRIARRYADAVCVGLLARRGIRAGSYDLAPVDSERRDEVFADANAALKGDELSDVLRFLRSRPALGVAV